MESYYLVQAESIAYSELAVDVTYVMLGAANRDTELRGNLFDGESFPHPFECLEFPRRQLPIFSRAKH